MTAQETLTVAEMIEQFIDSRRWTCTEATVTLYCNHLKLFLRWLDSQERQDLSARTITAYLVSLKDRGLSDATINGHYRSLRTLCRWLWDAELLARNPFEGRGKVPPAKIRRRYRRVYSDDDIRRLLHATTIPPHWKQNRKTDRLQWQPDGPLEREALQELALISLLLDTGMRNAEVCALSCGQIRRPQIVIMGKGGHEGVVFLSDATRSAVLALAGDRPDDAPLFRNWRGTWCATRDLRAILRRVAWRANVVLPPRPVHAFRHVFARKLLEQGVPSLMLRQFLRHQQLATTQIYAELDTSALERVHRQTSPLRYILRAEQESAPQRWIEFPDTLPLPQLHAQASPVQQFYLPCPEDTECQRLPTRGEVTRQRVLYFLGCHLKTHGTSPSHRDIREAMRLAWKGYIATLLDQLEADGFLKRTPGVARSISLTAAGWERWEHLNHDQPPTTGTDLILEPPYERSSSD